MPRIRTVLGDIDAAELGIANAHDHLLIKSGLILVKEPDFRLDSIERAVEEVLDFQKHGGQAVLDTAPIGVGRDPEGLLSIARRTDLHIIACTGFHKTTYYLDSHWRFRYSAEEVAQLWIDEIEKGMDRFGYEGPLVKRSVARAGAIKVASDYQVIEKPVRAAIEAAAIAHKATGAPIVMHTELGTAALEQVALLHSLGVDPAHIVAFHMDRNPDPFVHRDVAQTGAFLQYDGPGRIKYFPESTVIELLRKMFEASLAGHILFGGDNARRSYWKAYGGGPGLAYLLERFVPRLRREGFAEEHIRQLFVLNPARAFAFREPMS